MWAAQLAIRKRQERGGARRPRGTRKASRTGGARGVHGRTAVVRVGAGMSVGAAIRAHATKATGAGRVVSAPIALLLADSSHRQAADGQTTPAAAVRSDTTTHTPSGQPGSVQQQDEPVEQI